MKSVEFVKMRKKMKNTTDGRSKRQNMKWSDEMDSIFIDAMLEQKANGSRVEGTFTSAAYRQMVRLCNEKVGASLTKDHLKNRIKTLKCNFHACHQIFKNASGFHWNSQTNMFEAQPEVWRALIETNPNAKKWKNTPIHNYDKLLEIFAQDKLGGEDAMTAKEMVLQWKSEEAEDNHFQNVYAAGPELFSHDLQIEDCDQSSSIGVPSNANSEGATSLKGNKRKASLVEPFERKVEQVGVRMNVANPHRDRNPISGGVPFQKILGNDYSEKEVFEELERIEVPESLILDAYLYLVESKAKIRAFFGVPADKRRNLLYKMMGV